MTPKAWALAGAALLVAVAATGGVIGLSGSEDATSAAQELPVTTATVDRGKLSDMVSLNGTLTHRARPDGSPYAVINQASGTYTELPGDGDQIDCGDVLYRVDDKPVLLLCGAVPAYRNLHTGDAGKDVRQLNRNLHTLGYDRTAGVDIEAADKVFSWKTRKALALLQHAKGLTVTGELDLADAVFLPESVQISAVSGELGRSARPDAEVAKATSDTLEVRVELDPSQQGAVKKGDAALITLPDKRTAKGTVERLGRVARIPDGQDQKTGAATIPAYIALDEPKAASGLDLAPVRVSVTTSGVSSALSVPVTALVGKSGGGFAVEVVRAGGHRELIGVKLGLFDAFGGRVQVHGAIHAGDHVVVPST